MNKLRAIQERRKETPINGDLRSVGATPLLIEMPPVPFLAWNSAELSHMQRLQEQFNLKVSEQNDYVLIESRVQESVKHQSLRLWFVALRALECKPESHLFLSERSLLRDLLIANIGSESFTHPEELLKRPVEINGTGTQGLLISPWHQLILQQLGYPLVAKDVDLVVIQNDPLLTHTFEVKNVLAKIANVAF